MEDVIHPRIAQRHTGEADKRIFEFRADPNSFQKRQNKKNMKTKDFLQPGELAGMFSLRGNEGSSLFVRNLRVRYSPGDNIPDERRNAGKMSNINIIFVGGSNRVRCVLYIEETRRRLIEESFHGKISQPRHRIARTHIHTLTHVTSCTIDRSKKKVPRASRYSETERKKKRMGQARGERMKNSPYS